MITNPILKTADIVKTNIKVENKENFNAHPTQKLPIIKSYTNGKALESCEWGLIPSWSKKLKKFSPLINARIETIVEKITFKNLIQTSRCVVPADGYYEWKNEDKKKTPYYFKREDEELMFFAAIYQNNQFCIITQEATMETIDIHARKPLIINKNKISNYLNIKKEALDALNSFKPPKLKFYPVSREVNVPVNNSSDLIKSIKKNCL